MKMQKMCCSIASTSLQLLKCRVENLKRVGEENEFLSPFETTKGAKNSPNKIWSHL
jgi:hypothetical protein